MWNFSCVGITLPVLVNGLISEPGCERVGVAFWVRGWSTVPFYKGVVQQIAIGACNNQWVRGRKITRSQTVTCATLTDALFLSILWLYTLSSRFSNEIMCNFGWRRPKRFRHFQIGDNSIWRSYVVALRRTNCWTPNIILPAQQVDVCKNVKGKSVN